MLEERRAGDHPDHPAGDSATWDSIPDGNSEYGEFLPSAGLLHLMEHNPDFRAQQIAADSRLAAFFPDPKENLSETSSQPPRSPSRNRVSS